MSSNKNPEEDSNDLRLNILLGFLTVLLVVMLSALAFRLIYPTVNAQRASSPTHLIGEIIQIQVLNGHGTPGLAATFTNKLRSSGFDVVETGNFETFGIEETLVIDRIGNIDNARRVARALGVADKNILREISPGFYLDATVVIGSDYDQLNLK
ncbi:MAG: LytR C-terminal domain-containing protein [Bacteroidetes bacterium]|nr:LytR C-terminal domain-containing protein [Bacteroidota bacterium]MCH8525089.1 LytR C-terminal domain-containing protein [Balneolales bacterium]